MNNYKTMTVNENLGSIISGSLEELIRYYHYLKADHEDKQSKYSQELDTSQLEKVERFIDAMDSLLCEI